MSIAVIGANGQLGHAIAVRAESLGHSVERVTREGLDVSKFDEIQPAFSELKADTIFNCTAYNAVDRAESERDVAIAVNGLAPAVMAVACRRLDRRFVHVSTDYVFGRGHDEPIDESRVPSPLSAYGRSKRMGELETMRSHPDALIVRTTGLYSSRRNNFVSSMLGFAREGRRLTVVNDQWMSPTWVDPLAQVILELSARPISGVVHAVSHGKCSWYDFAAKIFELAEVEAELARRAGVSGLAEKAGRSKS